MGTNEHSDLKACWGILWRSFVLLPYMLMVFVVVGGVWLIRWVFPLCAAVLICSSEWWAAVGTVALWCLAVWSNRRLRLSRFFEPPPSLL